MAMRKKKNKVDSIKLIKELDAYFRGANDSYTDPMELLPPQVRQEIIKLNFKRNF